MCTLESWSFLEFYRGVVPSPMLFFLEAPLVVFVRVHQNKPLQQQTPTTCLSFISSTCCFNQSKCRMTRKIRYPIIVCGESGMGFTSLAWYFRSTTSQHVIGSQQNLIPQNWYPKISPKMNIFTKKETISKETFIFQPLTFRDMLVFWGVHHLEHNLERTSILCLFCWGMWMLERLKSYPPTKPWVRSDFFLPSFFLMVGWLFCWYIRFQSPIHLGIRLF